MARRIRTTGVRSDINVTPLVDVVLVLLIVFMVVTPLLQRGVPLQLPRAGQAAASRSGGDAVVVSLTAGRRTFLDGREVALHDLGAALASRLAAGPAPGVVVKGDRTVDYGTVREVLRELSMAHVTGVSLAAVPRTGGGAR